MLQSLKLSQCDRRVLCSATGEWSVFVVCLRAGVWGPRVFRVASAEDGSDLSVRCPALCFYLLSFYLTPPSLAPVPPVLTSSPCHQAPLLSYATWHAHWDPLYITQRHTSRFAGRGMCMKKRDLESRLGFETFKIYDWEGKRGGTAACCVHLLVCVCVCAQ